MTTSLSTATAPLKAELDAADRQLSIAHDGAFYTSVDDAERRAVYAAMADEFASEWYSNTGHWYTCERGHPFTVGECGRPMEESRCPECGAAIGGQFHNPAAGVVMDTAMDDLARGVEGL
jgi:hypothetical protein